MNIIKALRLSFLPASILPYFLGVVYVLQKSEVNYFRVLLGAIIVGGTHLSSNLINDYADSRSGVDWQDLKEYNFFGGSKLIQKGILSENWYKNVALIGYFIVIFLLAFFSFVWSDNSLWSDGFDTRNFARFRFDYFGFACCFLDRSGFGL